MHLPPEEVFMHIKKASNAFEWSELAYPFIRLGVKCMTQCTHQLFGDSPPQHIYPVQSKRALINKRDHWLFRWGILQEFSASCARTWASAASFCGFSRLGSLPDEDLAPLLILSCCFWVQMSVEIESKKKHLKKECPRLTEWCTIPNFVLGCSLGGGKSQRCNTHTEVLSLIFLIYKWWLVACAVFVKEIHRHWVSHPKGDHLHATHTHTQTTQILFFFALSVWRVEAVQCITPPPQWQ